MTSAHLLCPAAILSELLQRENRVLHFWTLKKRRLDQCQQYVVFERSAKQVCSELSLALSQFEGLYRGQGDQRDIQKRVIAAGKVENVGGGDEERKGNRLPLTSHSAFTKHSIWTLVPGTGRHCRKRLPLIYGDMGSV